MNKLHNFIDRVYVSIGKIYPKDVIKFNGELDNAIFEVCISDIDGDEQAQLDNYRINLERAIHEVDKDFKFEIVFDL